MNPRRPFRLLLERDVAEIERRLRLYRENAPKRICGAGEPISTERAKAEELSIAP